MNTGDRFIYIAQYFGRFLTMKLNGVHAREKEKIRNLEVLNVVLYVAENRRKWMRLPEEYGGWHVIYVWVNRWAKKGV